jgi:hypothetical protein
MSKNYAFQISDRFMIAVHNTLNAPTPDWNNYIEAILLSPVVVAGFLVYTEGGAPSAIQRKQLRDALIQRGNHTQPAGILTESIIARTAITALNLFLGGTVKAVPPHNIDEALTYIKAPPELWPQLKKTLDELKREIGISANTWR